MNFGLCKNSAGCATPGACDNRAVSACGAYTGLEAGSVAAMDSTMGELQYQTRSEEQHAAERAVEWRRLPYAKRPELVTAAEAMALDEAAGRVVVMTQGCAMGKTTCAIGVDVQDNALGAEIPADIATDFLVASCHGASVQAGWWQNKHLGDTRRYLREPESDMERFIAGLLFSNKLCLIHSEVSESMEGDRKSLPDDKLPQYPMRVVELADAAIRIFDLAGACIKPDDGFTFGEVLAAKLAFNAVRPDHKAENRAAAGGKAY